MLFFFSVLNVFLCAVFSAISGLELSMSREDHKCKCKLSNLTFPYRFCDSMHRFSCSRDSDPCYFHILYFISMSKFVALHTSFSVMHVLVVSNP